MTDAYIIGTTLPALAAALELAEVGLSVRVSADGAAVALAELDQRGEVDSEGALTEFLTHLAEPLGDRGAGNPGAGPVSREPGPVQLRNTKGGWTLQATPSVWGIPAVPMATQNLAILGGGAATRASLDRVKPVLTIGKTHGLGVLVRSRMGRAVEDRLVDPLVRERYGIGPDSVDVAIAAPGLNEALTRAGSLSGAVLAYSERYVARETRVVPAEGWAVLRGLLVKRLRLYGVEFSESPVQLVSVDESAPGPWLVSEANGEEFSVQAVVVDPAVPLPGALEARLSPLRSEAWRAQVRVQVGDPGVPDPDHPALQTMELTGGSPWVMRLERDTDSRWFARFAGPRVPGSWRAGDHESDLAEAVATARKLLELAGLRAVSEVEVMAVVAPHVSTARRDVEVAQLAEQRANDPTLLPVGVTLHGGDLALAIADSREAAVALRRRLTGISE